MFEKEFQVAKKAVKYVAKHILKEGATSVKPKGEYDYSTDKDIASENYIIEAIKKSFPNDNILSEEGNCENSLKDRTWIIDPIDGTVNYMKGLPLCCIQLAFYSEGKTQFSMIYLHAEKQLFYAINGKGAYLNGQRLQLEKNNIKASLAEVCIARFYDVVSITCDVIKVINNDVLAFRSFGSYGYSLAKFAKGGFGVFFFISHKINLWDCLPGELICKEAGAYSIRKTYKNYDYHTISIDEEYANKVVKIIEEKIDGYKD